MANSIVQIRRSNATAGPGTILASGELAYSYNSNTLSIGAQTGVGSASFVIGGSKYSYLNAAGAPGALTASATVIVDANSFISNTLTSALAIQTSSATVPITVTSISNSGSTYLGANASGGGAGNELATTAAIVGYVNTKTSSGGVGSAPANAVLFADGTVTNGSAGFQYTKATNTVTIGNSTVFATVNSTVYSGTANNALYLGGTAAAGYQTTAGLSENVATLTANNSTNFNGQPASFYQTASGLSANVATLTSNNALYLGGTIASGYQTTAGLSANVATLTANSANYLGTLAAAAYQTNAGLAGNVATLTSNNSTYFAGYTWAAPAALGGTTPNTGAFTTATATTSFGVGANVSLAAAALTFTGNSTTLATTVVNAAGISSGNSSVTALVQHVLANSSGNTTINTNAIGTSWGFNVNSSVLQFTGGNVAATSANLAVQNMVISGNLTVSGTVTSIGSSQLIVNGHFIELADNNLTTDVVDTGFFGAAGNSTATWYSGLARIASKSSNNNAYFLLFASNTNPNTATTIDATANTARGTLEAYLVPYGVGGVFVANSTGVSITANSTVSATLVANSLTLTTALGVASGGSGLNTIAAGSVAYGNGTGPLGLAAAGANGTVLQIINNLPAFGGIDGGTF